MEILLSTLPNGTVRSHRVIPFGVDPKSFHPSDATAAKEELRLKPETRVIMASFDEDPHDTNRGPSESLSLLREVLGRASEHLGSHQQVLTIGIGSPRPMERARSIELRFLLYPKNPETMARCC